MKLSLLLAWAFSVTISASVYSQNARININVADKSIRDVLHVLENQTDFRFFYNHEFADLDKTVSLNLENRPIQDILSQLLKNSNVTYKIMENNFVVITPSRMMQKQKVTGSVTDATSGEALPGVNILIEGTSVGTVTDIDGRYSIDIPGETAVLIFSSVGYNPEKVDVAGKNQIDISLVPDIKKLNEVVVVGYGTQKKVNLTGAVSPIESDELNQKAVGQLSSALQGIASGVTITQSTGQPGADVGTIRIRGVGTLNNNNPLVLVDGIPSSLDDVDANDVESISVLKDAAASSIYGVRAANGVILVTTKRGLKDKVKVSYSNYFGWQRPTELPNFVGAQDFMKLVNLTRANSGGGAVFTDSDIAAYNDPNRDTNKYPDAYWMDEVLQGSGTQQEHSLSIAGGTSKSRYRFSTNYFDQNGLVKNADFERLTVRMNSDLEISKRFNFSSDISAKLSNQTEPQDGMWFQFGQAAVSSPLLAVKYSDGTWGMGRSDGNPVRLQDEGGKYQYKNKTITGNFKLSYKVFEDLTITGNISANYSADYNSQHKKQLIYTDFFTKAQTVKGLNEITKQSYDSWFTNLQALANYKKIFGNHNLNVIAGVSRLEQMTDYLMGYRRNLPVGELAEIDAGAEDGQKTSGEAYGYGLLSYFGRLNYSFADRYLLEANVRRDGSSRFSEDNRWGVFPSFSAGWRISKEAFMADVNFIQELKLRASWGMLGNHEIGNYPYQSLMSLGYNYPFNGTVNSGARMNTYPNSEMTWETSDMTDVGLDFSVLSGKLGVTFDYYVKNTDDILLRLPIPSTVGMNAPYQNAGSVQNKGWELSVNYNDKIGEDFSYSATFNLSDVRNEITDLKGADWVSQDNDNRITAYKVGMPIGAFYGYETEGIFQSTDEISSHASQPGNIAPGDLKYKNQNPGEDNVINAKDRVQIGSDIPRYTYGFNLSATYKNIDFGAFFQGVGKADVNVLRMNKAPTGQDGNFKSIHNDSWTESNKDAAFPRLSTSTQNYVSSSFWIKSGAYLRLKNLQLGYTLPSSLTQKLNISRFRVFVGGQNLITWSKLKDYGIDPESPNDDRYYPQVKVYTFGVNVDF